MNFSRSIVRVVFLMVIVVVSCNKAQQYEKLVKPEIIVRAGDSRLTGDTVYFDADTVYVVNTSIVRNAGQVFKVEAGTLIKMGDRTSITINPGATIDAVGTVDRPIVFTSSAYPGGAGVIGSDGSGTHYWYGIRINGNSASQPQSSAGILSYVRVEFAGADENFLGNPSLLFNNVGAGTTINHIQVSYSFETPSFEFRGGNCNASHLFSYASGFHDFYLEAGYVGNLQFLFGYRHPYFPVTIVPTRLAGLFISGNQTNPTISNVTILGPDLQPGISLAYTERDPDAALLVGGGARFKIRNSVFAGFPKGGFYINSNPTASALNRRLSEFDYNYVQCPDSNRLFVLPNGVYPPFTSQDFKNFVLDSPYTNVVLTNIGDFKFTNLFKYDEVVPGITDNSPIGTGANFTNNGFDIAFYSKVSFLGSLGTENWLNGWINMRPLQTKYN